MKAILISLIDLKNNINNALHQIQFDYSRAELEHLIILSTNFINTNYY